MLTFADINLSSERPQPEPRAGWFGVFPELPGYQRSFLSPVVDARNKTVYKQTGRYEWTGGALKLLEVTLARDPAFKQKYTAETLGKQTPAPQQVRVGGRRAWLWDLEKEAEEKPEAVRGRLVVPLGPDGALIFEQKGPGPWEGIVELAERFDLARVEAALAAPPRTDFRLTPELFRAVPKGASFSDVVAWAGFPDQELRPSQSFVYHVADGSRVVVGFAESKLAYARHEQNNGRIEELIKE
jgi:hypothetical protein